MSLIDEVWIATRNLSFLLQMTSTTEILAGIELILEVIIYLAILSEVMNF